MKLLCVVVTFLFLSSTAYPKHLRKEKWYQDRWCTGIKEFVLPDRSRVDCLTKTRAIEIDFASKWAEAIGQCLYYAAQTNRLPGIGLIIESDKDYKYILKIDRIRSKYNLPIKLYLIRY